MKNLLRLICFSSVIAILAFFTAPLARSTPAMQDRIPDGIDNQQRVALHGQVPRMARPEFDEGAVAASTLLEHMTLVFSPSAAQQQELNALLAAQQDRNSPLYHQWLSTEQFGARFGLSDSDLAKVKDWLQQQGFTVTEVPASRDHINFSGTVAQAQAAFHASIHHFNVDGVAHFANTSDPAVPAALANVVTAIRGLHDFHPHSNAVKAHFTSYVSGNHFITPDDFATIYDLKPLYNQGIDGTGQTIAVVGQTDIQTSDIDAFRKNSGLPPTKLSVQLYGAADPGTSSGDVVEADLDVEWAGAIAPNAQIVYVNSNDAFQSLQNAVTNNAAPVISVSYGECEAQALTDGSIPLLDQVATQAAAKGITVVSASGDSGAADCDPPTSNQSEILATLGPQVDIPGAVPYVTSVGGTQFNDSTSNWSAGNNSFQGSAMGYIPEQVWNSTAADNTMAAGGGGVSTHYTSAFNNGQYASALAFQQNVTPDNGTARDVPDVSLAASVDHDGLLICSAGSCTNGFRKADTTFNIVGGTSAGTPAFAAMVALLNQMENSPGQGTINPSLYRLLGSSGFHDIVTGDNKIPCKTGTTGCPANPPVQNCPTFTAPPTGVSATNPCYGFAAVAGYDKASGLGSVDAYNLLHELQQLHYGSAPTTPTAPADFTVGGVPASINVTRGSGSATFTATFAGAASPINVSCFVAGGANPTIVTGMTCTPSATSVTTSGTQVTFTVTAASQVSSLRQQQPLHAPWSLAWTAISALVFCGGAAAGFERKRKRWPALGSGMLAIGALAVLASCGGGGSSSSSTPQTTVAAPAVSAVSVSPNAVIGTNSVTGSVTLASAPTAATTVSLSSNNPAATLPASVSVPAGSSSANFSIATKSVTAPTAVNITASTAGGSQTTTLNVTGVVVVVQGSVGPSNGTAFGSNVHVAAVPVNLQ